ncbi:MAG: hypothetical protein K2P99_07335 [Burkholderiales bacterium]|nr:hypothetical protein [Burkholderiales bacterium]
MSQHHFFTLHENKKTHILLGWDRPLQGFFLVIERDGDDVDIPFWSNLFIKESHPKKIDPFLLILKERGISLPDAVIEEVIKDGLENFGNKVVVHSYKNENYKRSELKYIPDESVLCLYDRYC